MLAAVLVRVQNFNPLFSVSSFHSVLFISYGAILKLFHSLDDDGIFTFLLDR